jgi:sporulation protein YlmC with PRC-barrel domain
MREEIFSAGLELLDRQIDDRDGYPVGKVDDLELQPGDDGRPVVRALLVGPMALGPRIGGRLGTWVAAVARRLRAGQDPEPIRIPMSGVRTLGPRIVLYASFEEVGGAQLELWLREKVVDGIPGSRHATG